MLVCNKSSVSVQATPQKSARLSLLSTSCCRSSRRRSNTVLVTSCRSQPLLQSESRRDFLFQIPAAFTAAAFGTALAPPQPALAAYGQKANVFGERTNSTEYYNLNGDGFDVNVPAKYVPTREREFGRETLAMYTDSFDIITTLSISRFDRFGKKKSVKDFGSMEAMIDKIAFVLGTQSYQGNTSSEGGFATNSVLQATLVDSSEEERNGKTYYFYNFLSRTADGDEGGKHQLVALAVGGDGYLYCYKISVGEKRWIKGGSTLTIGSWKSFNVA